MNYCWWMMKTGCKWETRTG